MDKPFCDAAVGDSSVGGGAGGTTGGGHGDGDGDRGTRAAETCLAVGEEAGVAEAAVIVARVHRVALVGGWLTRDSP